MDADTQLLVSAAGETAPLIEAQVLETRELWWNIHHSPYAKVVFYTLAAVAMAIFLYGMYQKIKRIAGGKQLKNDNRLDKPFERIRDMLHYGLAQAKIRQKQIPGLAHAAI